MWCKLFKINVIKLNEIIFKNIYTINYRMFNDIVPKKVDDFIIHSDIAKKFKIYSFEENSNWRNEKYERN